MIFYLTIFVIFLQQLKTVTLIILFLKDIMIQILCFFNFLKNGIFYPALIVRYSVISPVSPQIPTTITSTFPG
jgi:hypothetical protein